MLPEHTWTPLDNFWSGIADGPARRHCLLVPNDFTKPEIGDLDSSDFASANAREKFALVDFLFIELL